MTPNYDVSDFDDKTSDEIAEMLQWASSQEGHEPAAQLFQQVLQDRASQEGGYEGTDRKVLVKRMQKKQMDEMENAGFFRSASEDPSMIAMGRAFDKAGATISSTYHKIMGNDDEVERIRRDQANKDELYAPVSERFPVATTLGQAAPMMLPVGGKEQAAAGIMSKGVSEVMKRLGMKKAGETAAKSVVLDAGTEAAVFGALDYDANAISEGLQGAATAGVLKGVLTPFSRRVSDYTEEGKQKVKDVVDAGFKLTPGERLGTRFHQQIDKAMMSNPTASDVIRSADKANRIKANEYLARSVGEPPVDQISTDFILKNKNRIGKDLENIMVNNSGKITKDLENDAMSAYNDYSRMPSADEKVADKAFSLLVDNMDSKGRISGKKLQDIFRSYRKEATTAYAAGDKIKGDMFSSYQKILLDSMDGAASKEFKELNKQYALNRAIDNSSAFNRVTGDINWSTLSRDLHEFNSEGITGEAAEGLNKIRDFGDIKRSAGGSSSLAASRYIANLIRGGTSNRNMTGKSTVMTNFGLGIPGVGPLLARTYMSGYPMSTGLLGLSEQAPNLMALMASKFTHGE